MVYYTNLLTLFFSMTHSVAYRAVSYRLGGLLVIGVGLIGLTLPLSLPSATYAKEMGDSVSMGAPSAPRNPRVTMNVPGRISIAWDAPETGVPEYYAVYMTEGAGNTDFTNVSANIFTPGTQTYYDAYGISENKTYNFKIAAQKGSFESSNSPLVSVTQEQSIFVLSGHHNSPTSLHLSWTAQQATEGYTGYSVYRTTGNGEYVKIWDTTTLTPAYYDDINLLPETSYSYYVVVRKNDGTTRSAGVVQLSTPAAPPPQSSSAPQSSSILPAFSTPTTSAPGAAIQLSAIVMSPTIVQLSWTSVPGATAYTVYRRAAGSPTPVVISTLSSYFLRTNFVDAAFTPGTAYSYYVSSDSGQRSAEVSPVQVASVAAPQLTGKLTSKASAVLSWNAVPGAVSYSLFSRHSKDSPPNVLYGGTETTFNEGLFIPDRPYYYYVVAYGADDKPSLNSNEVVLLGDSYVAPSQITVNGMDNVRIKPGNAFNFRYSVKSGYLDTRSLYPYKGNFRIERSIINPRGTTIFRTSAIWNGKYGDVFNSTPTVITNSGWMKGDYKMVINVYALQENGRFIDSKTIGFKVE